MTSSTTFRLCPLRQDADEGHAVAGHTSRVTALQPSEVLVGPQIAHRGVETIGIADIAPGDLNDLLGSIAIQQHDGAPAIAQLFGPHLGGAVGGHAAALAPQWILVDGDGLLVDRKSTRLNSSHLGISY